VGIRLLSFVSFNKEMKIKTPSIPLWVSVSLPVSNRNVFLHFCAEMNAHAKQKGLLHIMPATIILLNGPSSSGKTTLSKAIQQRLTEPCYYTSYDLVCGHMTPRGNFGRNMEEDFLSVMFATARATALLGRNIIIDNCLFDTDNIPALCCNMLSDCDVLFVRVDCPADELRRREIARGDRAIGKAEWQNEHRTPKDGYDLVVNTKTNTTGECADMIVSALRDAEARGYRFGEVFRETMKQFV